VICREGLDAISISKARTPKVRTSRQTLARSLVTRRSPHTTCLSSLHGISAIGDHYLYSTLPGRIAGRFEDAGYRFR